MKFLTVLTISLFMSATAFAYDAANCTSGNHGDINQVQNPAQLASSVLGTSSSVKKPKTIKGRK